MILFAFKHNPSRMTFCTNCIEDCLHLVDFVSSSFANVGVKPKFWQSQRNFIAPSHLTCSKLSRSSRLNKLSWLSCCKFLIVIKGFVKHFGTKFRDMKREWRKNVLYTSQHLFQHITWYKHSAICYQLKEEDKLQATYLQDQ